MKKLTKLLVLVLSLALICGIFAIAAFAEETAEPTVSGWQYVNSSDETVTTDTMSTAITNAKAGTTVTLLADTEVTFTGKVEIKNNLTIDLGGNTLYMVHGAEGGLQPNSSKTVTLKNGTVVTSSNANYSSNKTNKANHSIFTNIGKNATVNLENVNTYGYAITYSWGNAYKVNVTGGEHHL